MAPRAGLRALPNIISSSRVLLAAGFVAADTVDARLGLVGLAAFTDVLDGWVARRGKWTSRWGALIDPFADRVFALVAVSTFLFTGVLSTVGYFVMISRDLMTAIGFLVSRMIPWVATVPFKARASGKLVTVLQFVTLAALLRFPRWVTACLWVVGIVSLYSIADYTFRALARADGVRSRLGRPGVLVVAAGLFGSGICHAGAQIATPPSYAEYRADAIVGRGTAAQGGLGAVVPLGAYVRFSVDGAAGATWRDGGTRTSGRVDAIGRFLLDPYREVPVGLSLGGGVSVPVAQGETHLRPYLAAVIDVEGRMRGPVTPAVQIGLGGGARIGVVLRTSSRRWR